MKILLTNDDGIEAGGIIALADALHPAHEIAVVAPHVERSAISHAVTFRKPLRAVRLDRPFPAFAVDGTPADCVKLALLTLLPWSPDLVLSGINRGINVGNDVLYSGTVAGALEAAMHGKPGLAVSLDSFDDPDFRPGARFTADLVSRFAGAMPPAGVALNVNLPDGEPETYRGVRWTRQLGCLFCDAYEHRPGPEAGDVYVLDGDMLPNGQLEPGSDALAVREGFVSITPLRPELTHLEALPELEKAYPDLEGLLRRKTGQP